MLSLMRMLEITSYRSVWIMGHKIRETMAARDAYMHRISQLSGEEMSQALGDRLDEEVVSRSDGWRA